MRTSQSKDVSRRVSSFVRVAVVTGVVLTASAVPVPGVLASASAGVSRPSTAAATALQRSNAAKAVPPGTGPAMLERQRRSVAAQSGVAPQDIRCWIGISFMSMANGHFVSAELLYGSNDGHDNKAMLRARGTAVGPWERYNVCRDDFTGLTDMQSAANGLAVSAEFGYPGMWFGELRARADVVGPWEFFYTQNPPGTGETWIAASVNTAFVSTEIGDKGIYQNMLRARAGSVGPWEEFSW